MPPSHPETPSPDDVRAALHEVIDPEIGINIVDLGLVYAVRCDSTRISIQLTMTSPSCPMSDIILDDIQDACLTVWPHCAVETELVWEPPWSPDALTPAAKAMLGWQA